jgi:hypothetical protein
VVRQRARSKWRLQDPAEDWCFGVFSMKARYQAGQEDCLEAAGCAVRRLDLSVTGGDIRARTARIDARSNQSQVVRITVASDPDGSWVSFSAGREWTQDGKHIIARLREAFECCLHDRGPRQG